MNHSCHLTAFIQEGGQRRPFSLKIEGPFETPDSREYYCRIESPELLGKKFNVYGEDHRQTQERALKFVQICLLGKKIYDAEGNSLDGPLEGRVTLWVI